MRLYYYEQSKTNQGIPLPLRFFFYFRMPKAAPHETYIKKYSEESLNKAIEEVNNGMPKRTACKKYKIPRATLQFRFSEKFTKSSHGPSPILSSQEEDLLVNWINDCQRKGFPRRKEDIQRSVKQFLDDSPRENPFKNNLPGDGWYKAFMKRHPNLTTRKSEGVSVASSAISEQDIRKWFYDIHSYLTEKGYDEVLEHPERLFNADETNFQLCPQNKRVIAPKGTKNVYEIELGKAKTTLTVLFTFSAAGTYTPPLIIFPGKRLRKEIGDSIPEGFTFATSDSGWMKTEIFYEYVANSFYPNLQKLGTQFPVILFVDGHKTHIDRKLSNLCTGLGIILVALYPNSTRILQPADVSTFKPLKDGWRKGLLEWRRSHPSEELTKKEFAGLLKVVISKSVRPDIITNGFRACGLYPWNPSSIDFSKCLGKNKAKTNIVPQINDENILQFSKFKDIIGSEKHNLFTQMDQQMDAQLETDEHNILYQLWKEFKYSNTEETHEEATLFAENLNDKVQTKETRITEANGSEIDVSNSMVVDENQNEDVQISNSSVLTISNTLNISEVDIVSAPIYIENYESNVWHEIIIDNPKNPSNDIPKENREKFTSESENNLIQEELRNGTNLNQYLYYPDTPQRKGKKQSERPSFILSSSSWKQFQDEKEQKKQNEFEEKENRKKERQRKKIEREEALLEKKSKRKPKEKKGAKKIKLDNNSKTSLTKIPKEIVQSREENTSFHRRKLDPDEDFNDVFSCSDDDKTLQEQGLVKYPLEYPEEPSVTLETTEVQIHQSNKENESSKQEDLKETTFDDSKINISSHYILKSSIENRRLLRVTKKLEFGECSEDQNRKKDIHIDLQEIYKTEDPKIEEECIFVQNNLNTGICFSCTKNITFLKLGVRCQTCTRSYHLICIKKHSLHKSNSNIFTCLNCLKRR